MEIPQDEGLQQYVPTQTFEEEEQHPLLTMEPEAAVMIVDDVNKSGMSFADRGAYLIGSFYITGLLAGTIFGSRKFFSTLLSPSKQSNIKLKIVSNSVANEGWEFANELSFFALLYSGLEFGSAAIWGRRSSGNIVVATTFSSLLWYSYCPWIKFFSAGVFGLAAGMGISEGRKRDLWYLKKIFPADDDL